MRRARRQLNSCRLILRVRACKLECRVGDCRLHLNLSLAPPPLHPLLAPPAGTLRFVRGPAFGVTPSPPHVTCSPRLLGGGIQGGEWVRATRFLAPGLALPRAGPSESCRCHWQWALQGRALRAENPASKGRQAPKSANGRPKLMSGVGAWNQVHTTRQSTRLGPGPKVQFATGSLDDGRPNSAGSPKAI